MAGSTTNISIRMDAELKTQADALFAELGMNLSTAFNIFVRQSLREGGIPFRISLNPSTHGTAVMPETVRIGVAKDRLKSPDNFDQYDGEIVQMFEETEL